MTVNIRLLCVDIPRGKMEGIVESESPLNVEEAIDLFLEKNYLELTASQLKSSQFLINKAPANLSAPLKDGDLLLVLRTLAGG